MLRLMLNSHPRLAVPFESHFIPNFYRKLDQYGDLEDPENRRRLLEDIAADPFVKKGGLIEDTASFPCDEVATYSGLIDLIFRRYANRNGKDRWGDKTPTYISNIDILRQLFPRSQIIHLVRDGRDVSLSLSGIEWGPNDFLRSAEDWRCKTILAHKMGRLLDEDYIMVRFEELVRTPQETLREICDFLGEPYSSKMLEYPDRARQQIPDESMKWHESSIGPPDASKAFEWKEKMSSSDRLAFERVAGDALEMFGYEVSSKDPSVLSRMKTLYHTLVKRW